jgi:DNA-binding transcriptional ArsR family regulator
MTAQNRSVTRERANISDPAVMRALAHPARLAILDHLSLNEAGATATECAEVVGLSPSATSYHLRALARAGMIVEAPSRGDGRERVWQRKYAVYSMTGDPDAGPEDFAAEMALVESILAHQNDKIRRYLAVGRQEGDWYEVATINERVLLLTAKELHDVIGKIEEIIAPYLRQERTDPPEHSRRVTLQLRAVPLLSRDVK